MKDLYEQKLILIQYNIILAQRQITPFKQSELIREFLEHFLEYSKSNTINFCKPFVKTAEKLLDSRVKGNVVFPWVTVWRDYKSGKWLGW